MTIMCLAIADYIINSINQMNKNNEGNNIKLSCKRLQKIIYFFDINYMKKNGESVIKDNFYAWDSGPVIPDVYYSYMQFQEGFMYPLKNEYINLDKKVTDVIDKTISETSKFSTNKLIEFSHIDGGPWTKHIKGKEMISKNEIKEFYDKLDNIYISKID